VQLVDLILDNRISCSFVESTDVENIIFCRPLEENLDNISIITTKNTEFVYNFIQESAASKYIEATVRYDDGRTYSNVQFKLVTVENDKELPHSTINPSLLGEASTIESPATRILIEENNTIPVVDIKNDVEDTLSCTQPITYDKSVTDAEYIGHVLELEEKLEESHQLIEKQRAIIERDKIQQQIAQIETKLSQIDNDTCLFSENIKERKEELLKHVDSYVSEVLKEKNEDIPASVRRYIDKGLARISNDIHRQVRIMMDLVGGGGSVAQQFAAGGTINGDLNVTGQYLSGGIPNMTGQPQTFTSPVTSSGDFIIFNINGTNHAVQTWKY
jgi:hypothetical protein